MSPDQDDQPYAPPEPWPPNPQGGPVQHQSPTAFPPPQQWHPPPPQPPAEWSPPPQTGTAPPQAPARNQGPSPPQQAPSPQQVSPPQQAPPPTAQPVQPPQGVPQPGRPQLRPVVIEELVETDVVTAERDTPVQDVVADMAQEDVGSVVVVEDERPVGILTDRTIALALESTTDLSDQQAEDLLTDSIVTGTAEMSVFEAIRWLEEEEIRRLPIVDEEGQLTGIVTLDDILVLLSTELGNLTSVVKAQSPRL